MMLLGEDFSEEDCFGGKKKKTENSRLSKDFGRSWTIGSQAIAAQTTQVRFQLFPMLYLIRFVMIL